ncbi:hypothetical protein CVIRNUC_005338 [Coccomyxa viridis]|uniref:Uncharacterized protein n=1 Tax=Coccomyxa viridis TaxID=1274662 RepID=A0AAV1I757_9CHLO|nr:hypothetical protein CVIRNUC_005338 [Coccomyxa viridis]
MDAGGPSAEPLAKGKIEPIDWRVCENVYEAKQKLEYINHVIKIEQAACSSVAENAAHACHNRGFFLFIPSCASGKVPLRTPSALPVSSVTQPVKQGWGPFNSLCTNDQL